MSYPDIRPLTPSQEQFAVDIASGMKPVDAFLRSYRWSGSRRTASTEAAKLARKPHVAARIAELRDQYAKAVVEASRGSIEPGRARAYTVADAMAELDNAMELAKVKENPVAMIKVVEVRIRLYGLGVAPAENPAGQRPLTYEELVDALDRINAVKLKGH